LCVAEVDFDAWRIAIDGYLKENGVPTIRGWYDENKLSVELVTLVYGWQCAKH
jgi:hypothetical protein